MHILTTKFHNGYLVQIFENKPTTGHVLNIMASGVGQAKQLGQARSKAVLAYRLCRKLLKNLKDK